MTTPRGQDPSVHSDEQLYEFVDQRLDGEIDDARWAELGARHGDRLTTLLQREQWTREQVAGLPSPGLSADQRTAIAQRLTSLAKADHAAADDQTLTDNTADKTIRPAPSVWRTAGPLLAAAAVVLAVLPLLLSRDHANIDSLANQEDREFMRSATPASTPTEADAHELAKHKKLSDRPLDDADVLEDAVVPLAKRDESPDYIKTTNKTNRLRKDQEQKESLKAEFADSTEKSAVGPDVDKTTLLADRLGATDPTDAARPDSRASLELDQPEEMDSRIWRADAKRKATPTEAGSLARDLSANQTGSPGKTSPDGGLRGSETSAHAPTVSAPAATIEPPTRGSGRTRTEALADKREFGTPTAPVRQDPSPRPGALDDASGGGGKAGAASADRHKRRAPATAVLAEAEEAHVDAEAVAAAVTVAPEAEARKGAGQATAKAERQESKQAKGSEAGEPTVSDADFAELAAKARRFHQNRARDLAEQRAEDPAAGVPPEDSATAPSTEVIIGALKAHLRAQQQRTVTHQSASFGMAVYLDHEQTPKRLAIRLVNLGEQTVSGLGALVLRLEGLDQSDTLQWQRELPPIPADSLEADQAIEWQQALSGRFAPPKQVRFLRVAADSGSSEALSLHPEPAVEADAAVGAAAAESADAP